MAKIIEKLDVNSRNSYEKQNKIIEKKVTGRHQPFFMNEILSNPCEKKIQKKQFAVQCNETTMWR